MRREKRLLFTGLILIMMFVLTGCGKQKEISIQDGYVKTILSVGEKSTVKDAIEEAELNLREKDEVVPALETPVAELKNPIVIERYAKVTLMDDGTEQTVELTGAKVKDALEGAKVVLNEYDLINYDDEVYLKDEMEIQIIRRQKVILVENGEEREIITTAKTIKELLDMENIKLGEDDRISPKVSKKIKPEMKITLQRVTVEKETVIEPISFQTEKVYSDSMYKGTSKVTRAGVKGEKEVVYEITYVDGKEESRKKIEEKVIKKPVNQIVTLGKKTKPSNGKTIASKQTVYDCDGSGHGYHIITYTDGTVEYKNF